MVCIYQNRLFQAFINHSLMVNTPAPYGHSNAHTCQQKPRNGLTVGFLTRPELKFFGFQLKSTSVD
ncbi:hypothetical protein [Nostoc favosum]|uniref:Uncharacterized protein n=1 Tax=Nostoc favosum CHAB5714 TaxID=2780399 RepID=A0ABS8I1J0_9NOSO|nr:hypothetical protein [Nostoc favosum]MCC5597781.1 hypothetical protein [Nostoc favosum CHAB5714]